MSVYLGHVQPFSACGSRFQETDRRATKNDWKRITQNWGYFQIRENFRRVVQCVPCLRKVRELKYEVVTGFGSAWVLVNWAEENCHNAEWPVSGEQRWGQMGQKRLELEKHLGTHLILDDHWSHRHGFRHLAKENEVGTEIDLDSRLKEF